jgi:hypothetical protein
MLSYEAVAYMSLEASGVMCRTRKTPRRRLQTYRQTFKGFNSDVVWCFIIIRLFEIASVALLLEYRVGEF